MADIPIETQTQTRKRRPMSEDVTRQAIGSAEKPT